MLTNIGMIDRVIRLTLASALLYLGFYPLHGTTLGTGLMAVGFLSFFSGVVGFCGLYKLLGITTRSNIERF
jgi:Protein of unknown function (DUF2892)